MQETTISQSEPAPYADIGNLLRAARKDLRISTQRAAEMLHIRASYLEALEDGRFEALPGAAYAKGYLQNYAAFLQLDKDEILKQFEQVEASLKRGFFLPHVLRREKKPTSAVIWGGVAAAAVIYGLWLLLGAFPHASISVVDAPPHPGVVRAYGKTYRPHNLACFQSPSILYPPCHMTWAAEIMQPQKRQLKSVMDLAVTQE